MDELRAGNPVVVGDVTLVPVERCLLQSHAGDMGRGLSGLKEPLAIVVCDADGPRAFDMQGAEIPVDSFVRKVPGLGPILAPLSP